MTPESVLNKIKLLSRLAESPNEHEAANAREMVAKLIAKYNISPEELKTIEDKKAAYGDEELLFKTPFIVGWMNQLALGLANKFDCKIVQEECVPLEGLSNFNYYVYGEDEDVHAVKFIFPILERKINQLVEINCHGRGNIYINSYCEGLVQAIKHNIETGEFDLPKVNRNMINIHGNQLNNGTSNLVVPKQEKEEPTQQRVDVATQSFIKDIQAYFKGLYDGKYISIQDTLDEAAQEDVSLVSGHQEDPSPEE